MRDVFNEVCAIIREHSGTDLDEMTLATKFEDLNIASLDLVEIMFEIEERFKIEIPSNVTANSRLEFATIGEVVHGVNQILAKPKTT